jgi:uncharacterized membrane protein YkvA (DUF1232 family)
VRKSALPRIYGTIGLAFILALGSATAIEASDALNQRAPRPLSRTIGRHLHVASVTSNFASVSRSLQPIENQLSAGTTNLLRTVRKWVRQVIRRLSYGAGSWSSWLPGLVLFLLVALIVPLLGRDSLRTFRERGFREFMRELSLALAVYVRLLMDGRTPVVGKALLAFAVVYGAAPRDLFPDRPVLNYLDDLILLVLASRSFMILCSQEVVEEHAAAAGRAREESLRKKLSRRRAAKGTSSSSTATESHR